MSEGIKFPPGVTPGTGFLAGPSYHRIDTSYARSLIEEAVRLVAVVDGVVADGTTIEVDERTVLPIMAMDRACNLLRMAAEAVNSERHAATGWPQV